MTKSLLCRMHLFSVIIIPVSTPTDFLDLQYKKLPPNKVKIEKEISISVNDTASPLFYKFEEVKRHNEILVEGEVQIERALSSEEKDAYFQLGVVYEGDYKPNWLVKKILPEWLLKILSLNEDYGVGNIDFLHVTNSGYQIDKLDNVRDIKMMFKTVGKFDNNLKFQIREKLRERKILGLWFRADGDDHKGKFITKIKKVEIF